MSLLIKALKKAEQRHQEATAQAIEMVATDPSFQAGPAPQAKVSQATASKAELSLQADPPAQEVISSKLETPGLAELISIEEKYITLAQAHAEQPATNTSAQESTAKAMTPALPATEPLVTKPVQLKHDEAIAKATEAPAERASSVKTSPTPMNREPGPPPRRPISAWLKLGSATALAVVACAAYLAWQMRAPTTSLQGSVPQGSLSSATLPAPPSGQSVAAKPAAVTEKETKPGVEPLLAPPVKSRRVSNQAGSEQALSSAGQSHIDALISKVGPHIETTRSRGTPLNSPKADTVDGPSSSDVKTSPTNLSRAQATNALAPLATPKSSPRLIRNEAADRVSLLLEQAFSAVGRQDRRTARQLYEQALEIERTNTDALVALASLSAREGDSNAAERLYARVLDLDPSDSAARAGLASLRVAADPTGQESQLRHLLAGNSVQPSLQFALGNSLAAQSRWNEAQQAYFLASSGDALHPDYAFNLAISLERLHQTNLALVHYRRALELSKNRPGRFSADQAQSRIHTLELRLSPQTTSSGTPDAILTKD